MIINSGTCENVISEEKVSNLQLKVEKRPHPYKLTWFKKGIEATTNKHFLVSRSMGNRYYDKNMCEA